MYESASSFQPISKGDYCCDFPVCFSRQCSPFNELYSYRKEFAPTGENSFLYEMTPIEKEKEFEKMAIRVSSLARLHTHLQVFKGLSYMLCGVKPKHLWTFYSCRQLIKSNFFFNPNLVKCFSLSSVNQPYCTQNGKNSMEFWPF